jgi:CRISPR-associated endonuclease/helicase Cas3
VNISFHYKLKSHPDRLLKYHLLGVRRKALTLYDSLKFDFPNFNRDEMREVIHIASLFHDFGKATSFFQNYIQNLDIESTEDSRKKRSHGLISALLVFGILKEKFPENLILPLFGFIIVLRHHGNLKDINTLIVFSDKEMENVLIQAEHLEWEEVKNIVREFTDDKFITKSFIFNIVDYFQPRTPRELKRLNQNFSIEHYFIFNLLYSILLQADKTDAILNDDIERKSEWLSSNHIHSFKKKFLNVSSNPIDIIRECSFHSVESNITQLNDKERILSINIPTGSGKTITSLNAALKLCEKFKHTHIIYCLPFTSVVDQNFDVFDKIRKSADLPDDSGILMKHHHLTDILYNSVSDVNVLKEYFANKALHLIEGWNSNITVTTFVQLMCSLISYKNSSLRKFNRFSNAVIILDEIQSIPHEYWSLVNLMFSKTTQFLNSRIILVTATMPLIFSEKDDEIIELVENKQEMFCKLNRIELDVTNLNREHMEWNDFCKSTLQLVEQNKSKDILFVMNTIRSAQDLFNLFKDKDMEHELLYLSSHIIPQERLNRINQIKQPNKENPLLVVSTQLVEAGVDIDFDIVVRDFAPLDSIFQTCGRCNRENRNNEKGKVLLFSLKDSNSWTPSGIYQNFLKQKTMKVLKKKTIIQESEFYQLSFDYFNEIKKDNSQLKSLEILRKIEKLEYCDDETRIEINLIDNDYSSSIFIEIDKKASTVWKYYMSVMDIENGYEKIAALKQAKRDVSEYIINIPKKCFSTEHDSGIYHLINDRVHEYYDEETGFKIDKVLPSENSVIFL